uniref:Uncharacterized protein n=1 Tax=Acrobeloides nanus TaxID=290746 RepID=A0A914D3D2_9BILA
AKAKAILKAEPYITKHERLVYRQCEKEAINPVALAKCIVSLMNSRDQALTPVQFSEQNDDAITFWDVIMPWKRMTNSKAYNTIGQTTDSTPESSNYIDLTPLARPMEKAAHKMSNLQKLKILKEFTEMQQHAQEFTKRINSDNSNFLRKHGFPFVYDTQKPKNLSFAEDVIDLINGYLKRANMNL